jgi:hypothetical protein
MKYTLDGQSLGPVLKGASDLDELRSMALYDGMLYVVRQTSCVQLALLLKDAW